MTVLIPYFSIGLAWTVFAACTGKIEKRLPEEDLLLPFLLLTVGLWPLFLLGEVIDAFCGR